MRASASTTVGTRVIDLTAPRRGRGIGALGMWVCLLALACGPERGRTPVVARVGEASLTVAELENRAAPGLNEDKAAAQRREFVDKWVEQQLVYQEAIDRGLDENARVRQLLDEARRDVLVASFLDREFAGSVDVSDAEVADYFAVHAEEFTRAEDEIRAQHILLLSPRDAQTLRQKLLQGETFEEAAREHSQDVSTKGAGGDLGYFGASDYPELWEACQNLTLNRLSKPVESNRGLHLVRVLDRQEAGSVKDIDQVRPAIVEALVRQRYRQRLEELVQRLKSEKSWEIDESQLHLDAQ